MHQHHVFLLTISVRYPGDKRKRSKSTTNSCSRIRIRESTSILSNANYTTVHIEIDEWVLRGSESYLEVSDQG